MDLLSRVLKNCPGFIPAVNTILGLKNHCIVIRWLILFFGFQYVEMSRCNLGQSLYEEASRVLQHCLTLQPHCSPVLLAMAKVEVTRGRTPAADRLVSPNNRYLDQPRHYRFLIFQTSR